MHDTNTPAWLGLAFPILFVGLWLLVLNVLASIGGWRSLAHSYHSTDRVEGERFAFRSGSLGGVNYNGCLHFTVSPAALAMSLFGPFRLGDRPLLVPWHDISAQHRRGWVMQGVDLRFAKEPQVRLRLSRKLAEQLIAASGSAVHIHETI